MHITDLLDHHMKYLEKSWNSFSKYFHQWWFIKVVIWIPTVHFLYLNMKRTSISCVFVDSFVYVNKNWSVQYRRQRKKDEKMSFNFDKIVHVMRQWDHYLIFNFYHSRKAFDYANGDNFTAYFHSNRKKSKINKNSTIQSIYSYRVYS